MGTLTAWVERQRLAERQVLASPRDKPTRRRVRVAPIEAGAIKQKEPRESCAGNTRA